MPDYTIVFFVLAAIAVATAAGMIISRNSVYSAVLLVLNFVTVALLYLTLGAPFIALSQVTVYAGSIMVLFLFVIMLLGAERLPDTRNLRSLIWIAIPLALLLGWDLVSAAMRSGVGQHLLNEPASDYGAPVKIGQLLFTQYALPFEITAVILLAAAVGAIVLAKVDRTPRKMR